MAIQRDTTIPIFITIVMPDGIKLTDRTLALVEPEQKMEAAIDLAAFQAANQLGWSDEDFANYLPYLDIQITERRD